jgi:FkbM family methyltransferase
LKEKKNGFYIEVGSNHPVLYSNTFKLYLEGWKGILIDGNPDLIALSRRIRSSDICLNEIISDQSGEVEFSLTPDSLYSHIRTGEEISDAGSREKILKKQTKTLTAILDRYLEQGQVIDLLSIDTEGHDLAVLKSLDLVKYKPGFIVIEDLGLMQNEIPDKEIMAYMEQWKYNLVSRDVQNLYFKAQAQ